MVNRKKVSEENLKEARAAAFDLAATVADGAGRGIQLVTDPGSFLREMAEKMRGSIESSKSYDEQKERQATANVMFAASQHKGWSGRKPVTQRRLKELIQSFTLKAMEARVDERVNAIVAAGIGGCAEELATPDDLYAADWILNAKDFQLALLRDWLPKVLGSKPLEKIYLWSDLKDGCDYPYAGDLDQEFRLGISKAAQNFFEPSIWHGNSILFNTNSTGFVIREGRKIFKGHGRSDLEVMCEGWPTPLCQRIHNALASSKDFMLFETRI